jgi:hypothetical protein
MIRVPITASHREQQRHWSTFKGNRHTIRKDGGNMVVGDLAEIVFAEMFPDAKRISDIDYAADFVLHGERVDVKAKQRNGPCRPNYSCSVERRQRDANCDWYAFFSYNARDDQMEFLGWRDKASFFADAELWEVGQTDFLNGWKASAEAANLDASKLWSDDDRESIIERAAIMEYDGGLSRTEANQAAAELHRM